MPLYIEAVRGGNSAYDLSVCQGGLELRVVWSDVRHWSNDGAYFQVNLRFEGESGDSVSWENLANILKFIWFVELLINIPDKWFQFEQ